MFSFDVAQICENGHVVSTGVTQVQSYRASKYCTKCGAESLEECLKCGSSIRGDLLNGRGVAYARPAYCHDCGDAYPWTVTTLRTLSEVLEHEPLSAEDRRQLNQDAAEVVAALATSPVAAGRIKRILGQVGKASADTFLQVLLPVASDAVKRVLIS